MTDFVGFTMAYRAVEGFFNFRKQGSAKFVVQFLDE